MNAKIASRNAKILSSNDSFAVSDFMYKWASDDATNNCDVISRDSKLFKLDVFAHY